MRLDLVYPTLPPAINGIGDYTVHMARALSEKKADVRVLTGRDQPSSQSDLNVVPAFTTDPRSGIGSLTDAVQARPPDWLIVQFEQFSYGRWGLNPYLPYTLHRIKQSCPRTSIAIMVHEDGVSPTESLSFATMSLWQWPQFWVLGQIADRLFFSIDQWARAYQSWFPRTPIAHLPVGSNIPRVSRSTAEARRMLHLPREAFIVGIFGSAHPSRQLDRIAETLSTLHSHRSDVSAVYVGTGGTAVQQALPPEIALYDLGTRPPDEVSAAFAAMDLYLAPFAGGASTRRGSFMVGLQHEVPTVSTSGDETDELLRGANGSAFLLAPWDDSAAFREAAIPLVQDEARRSALGTNAGAFYQNHFSWSHLADRLIEELSPEFQEPPAALGQPPDPASESASSPSVQS